MDFVHDYLEDGRRIRTLNVVDAFSRECLAIEVATSLPSARVVRVLDTLVWQYGLPETLRVDNGPEFISMTLDGWAARHGVKVDFIQPGKPTQNGHVESFNGHFATSALLSSVSRHSREHAPRSSFGVSTTTAIDRTVRWNTKCRRLSGIARDDTCLRPL
jgi:transposase InsO family protein